MHGPWKQHTLCILQVNMNQHMSVTSSVFKDMIFFFSLPSLHTLCRTCCNLIPSVRMMGVQKQHHLGSIYPHSSRTMVHGVNRHMWNYFARFWFDSDVFWSRNCPYNTLCSWNDGEENAFHVHCHISKEQTHPGAAFTPKCNMSMWLSPTSLRILHPVIQPHAGILPLFEHNTSTFMWDHESNHHPASKIPVQWEGCPDRMLKCGVWRRRGAEVQWWFLKTSSLFFPLSLTLTLTNMGILFM